VDAFAEKLGAEESKESGSGIPTPLPQEDKRSNYHNFSLPQENLHKMASNIAEMASSYLEKEGIAELASSFLNAHIPGNSKPALRFVRLAPRLGRRAPHWRWWTTKAPLRSTSPLGFSNPWTPEKSQRSQFISKVRAV